MKGIFFGQPRWGGALAGVSMVVLAACMTVSGKQNIVPASSATIHLGKSKIAILPVKAQTSLAPDSVAPIRAELNKRLGTALRAKFPAATIADVPEVADLLNQKGSLPALEQLFSTYDSTGVLDKRPAATLGNSLNSPHLLLARLKAEKLDVGFISKATGGSLELMLVVAQTGNVLWSGTGEWKKGGIFGAGGASPELVAQKLVELSFSTLPAETGATSTAPAPTPSSSTPPTNVAPTPQPKQTAPVIAAEPVAKPAAKTRSVKTSKTKTQKAQQSAESGSNKKAASKSESGKETGAATTGDAQKSVENGQTKPDTKAKPAASKVRAVTDL